MAKPSRTSNIIAQADDATRKVVEIAPASRVAWRARAGLIVNVCRELVSGKPAQEPTSILVSELGRSRHAGFPASQTLLNGYGDLLRIWRSAYFEMLSAANKRSSGGRQEWQLSDEEMGTLDAGARARVTLLVAMLREAKTENDRLRKLVLDSIPVTAASPNSGSREAAVKQTLDFDTAPLRAWLADNEDGRGYLTLETSGLVAGRRTRPGLVVIPGDVLAVIRTLLGPVE